MVTLNYYTSNFDKLIPPPMRLYFHMCLSSVCLLTKTTSLWNFIRIVRHNQRTNQLVFDRIIFNSILSIFLYMIIGVSRTGIGQTLEGPGHNSIQVAKMQFRTTYTIELKCIINSLPYWRGFALSKCFKLYTTKCFMLLNFNYVCKETCKISR